MSVSLHVSQYSPDDDPIDALRVHVRVANDQAPIVWVGGGASPWSLGLSLDAAMTLGERLIESVTAWEDAQEGLGQPGSTAAVM